MNTLIIILSIASIVGFVDIILMYLNRKLNTNQLIIKSMKDQTVDLGGVQYTARATKTVTTTTATELTLTDSNGRILVITQREVIDALFSPEVTEE